MNRALLDLQELDSQILGFARQKARLDNGQNARTTRDELQSSLTAAETRLRGLQSDLKAREDELKAAEEKIEKQRKRLMNTTSPHELSALERDIAALGKARGDLDETILETMDAISTATSEVENNRTALSAAEADVTRIESAFKSETAQLDANITKKRAERPALAGRLSATETEKYNAAFKKFNGLAVAKIVSGVCSACGTTNSLHYLREAKTLDFPTCESCGRLIYVQ